MGWIEARLKAIELRTEYLFRRLQAMLALQTNDRQQLLAASQAGAGGSGTTSPCYALVPSSTMAAATGQPGGPSTTVTVLTGQSIYTMAGGSWHLATSSVSVINGMMSPVTAGYTAYAIQNSDGTYLIITQDCNN